MNILLATTEAVPFAKTGGLGDVCGALPVELEKLGQQVTMIMPAFRQAIAAAREIVPTGVQVEVPISSKLVRGEYLRATLPGSQVPVYLVKQDAYFDRPSLYGEGGGDYRDNCERFVFFCRAVLEAIRLLRLPVDLIHVNDWQTGLIPAYLKIEYATQPDYERIASLLTIHNMAYQGTFWHWDMVLTGLDWKYFNWRQMEFYGQLNLLKTGLAFADSINAVSQRYAEEIQTAPLGCGLEGMLSHRRDALTGIINGVDYSRWDPTIDEHLPMKYGVDNVREGKAVCKAALQQELGLPQQPRSPLIGIISRLSEQKGFDLIVKVIQDWVQTSAAQWVVLGTGDPQYHELLQLLAERHPQKVAVKLDFCEPLAHRIEAAADLFLMPSRYEPCGLNQLYSLRYGAVPVVRATGGLADTIVNATDETIADRTATGFSFREYSTLALSETLWRACDSYANPTLWRQLMETGMRQDWSWAQSARKYVTLYRDTLARARRGVF